MESLQLCYFLSNMSSLVGLLTLDSLTLRRLLRRDVMEQIVFGAKIACGSFAAIIIVLMLREAIDGALRYQSALGELDKVLDAVSGSEQKPAAKEHSNSREFANIVSRNVFGPFAQKTSPVSATPVKPIVQVPLDLIGTYLQEKSAPYAIIEDRNKKMQDIFMVGDTVFGAAKVLSISPDRVEINRNGTTETLTIDLISKRGAGSADSRDGGVTSENDEYIIEETEVDKALSNLPLLLTQARAVPYFKDGQAIGLRLFAVKSGSLFEKIGLKNGDILKNINGNSLGDLSQALKLFERLKAERSLTLSLERDRQDRDLKYQIR